MRTCLLIALALPSALAIGVQSSIADKAVPPPIHGSDTIFPTYSRQDVANVCLTEYGMENSSILDCVARDKNYESALSKSWPDVAERFRKDCVGRLADQHLTSYVRLDRCIRSLEREAAAPE